MKKPQVAKDYPALTTGTALSVVSAVLGLLVTHHVIGSAHVGEIQSVVDPLVLAALPALGGAIVHRLVQPMSKVQAWIVHQSHGMLTDADFDRIAAVLADRLGNQVDLLLGDDHPDASAVGPPTVPSRQAGAPAVG